MCQSCVVSLQLKKTPNYEQGSKVNSPHGERREGKEAIKKYIFHFKI